MTSGTEIELTLLDTLANFRREATEAHLQARKTLVQSLSHSELASIESVQSVNDLHAIASKAQELSQRRPGWSRGRTVLLTLDRYKGVLDVIAQAHAEYTCFAWGAIKWILTFAVNYVKLLQKLSAMLEDIGYCLPRIQLYHDLLPTKRLACISSQLYAAVINYLTQTFLFFSQSKSRRLFSIFHGPLEAEFHVAMDRIQHLSCLVEDDARASALAFQHAANNALYLQLQEVNLITRHAMQSVLDVKQLQARYLLRGTRADLFHGHDQDLIFQHDMFKLWTTLVSPGWKSQYQAEMLHNPFFHQKQASFAYVLTEQAQFLVMLNIISQKLHRPEHPAQVVLCWSPGMTMESALASLIYQYLENYPEMLLLRCDPEYYAGKISRAPQIFEALLEIYLQIIMALHGSMSMIIIPLNCEHASMFVKRMTELRTYWTSRLHSNIIYNVTSPTFPVDSRVIELDNEYDLDLGLDTSETLFRALTMCLGVFGNLTEEVQATVWSSLR